MSLVVTNTESRRYTVELGVAGTWWILARGDSYSAMRAGNELQLLLLSAQKQWFGVLKRFPSLVLTDWAMALATGRAVQARVRDTQSGKTWVGPAITTQLMATLEKMQQQAQP